MGKSLQAELEQALQKITVRAWRLYLETPGVMADIPMIRGVWGRALREFSLSAYRAVFEGNADHSPRYILRPAGREVEPKPAVEFLLFGPPDQTLDAVIWAAWESACRLGLGKQRLPFAIAEACPLAWDGTQLNAAHRQPGFSLWPLPAFDGQSRRPCWLCFDAPLRLLRDDQLIEQPALPDLTIAAIRRIQAIAADDAVWSRRHEWLNLARSIPAAPWQGRPLDFHRYSGSQQQEVDQHGVAGWLGLPQGPGPIADLIAAAQWTHLGKVTVMGLGQLRMSFSEPKRNGSSRGSD